MVLTGDDSATIFALSTGGLPSAIAVIRVSGPESGAALVALASGYLLRKVWRYTQGKSTGCCSKGCDSESPREDLIQLNNPGERGASAP